MTMLTVAYVGTYVKRQFYSTKGETLVGHVSRRLHRRTGSFGRWASSKGCYWMYEELNRSRKLATAAVACWCREWAWVKDLQAGVLAHLKETKI